MAGILGLPDPGPDPSTVSLPTDLGPTIQGLLAQLRPSADVVNAANQRAKLDFFLGMMGAPIGREWAQIGQSGKEALADRDNYIKTQQALTAQNMQLVMPLLQFAQNQQFAKQMQNILNGGQASPNIPTQPGPPAAFQQPGGAQALMSGAIGGAMPAQSQLPTQVPAPSAMSPQQAQFNALNKLNLQGMMLGRPDMASAINAAFPQPTALRPNAAAIDRFGNIVTPPMPIPPSGSRFDPSTGAFVQVPNAERALALPKVTQELVERATTPQPGVLPGGGQGIVGTQLGAMGGANGPYSFLNNLTGSVPVTATTGNAPAGPVQTKLSPEQEENSKALGEQAASYREAQNQSLNALAQLKEMQGSLKYFTPGPTLPFRAGVAGYAQEVPGVGRVVANALVPNSQQALPAIAALEKLSVGLTAEQSKVFGSREGQQVIGMIKSAMPNAAQVPGAPQVILDAQTGVHQWIVDKTNAALQWQQDPAHHGSLAGFSEAWNSAHPVSSYVNLRAIENLAKGTPTQGAPQSSTNAPRSIVRTGTYQGRRVVQYSDGTVAPAQ